jgi:hypothetical protein
MSKTIKQIIDKAELDKLKPVALISKHDAGFCLDLLLQAWCETCWKGKSGCPECPAYPVMMRLWNIKEAKQ